MMERITSRKNPLLMKIRRLASGGRRERQAEGEYLGDGIKLLEEALRWSAPPDCGSVRRRGRAP